MQLAKFCIVAILLLLTGCSGDSEASKKRLLETGNKYYNAAKYREASIIYRKLIQKDARYGEAYYRLGLNELKLGRYLDSIRAFRRAVELQPDNDDAHAKLGDLYLAAYLADRVKNKPILADLTDLYERMLKRNPRSYDGLRLKGYVYVAKEDLDKATEAFETANQIKPDQPELLLALVQTLYTNKKPAEAEKLAREAIEKHKTYGPLYDTLYVAKIKEGNLPEAEKILLNRLENNPKSMEAYQMLASHYAGANDRDRMVATLQKVAENKNDFPSGHQAAGDFYLRLGDLAATRREYEAAIAENPKDKRALQKKIVEVVSMQGKQEEAVELSNKLLAEAGDDAEAKAIRAALRLRSGKPEELDAAIGEFQSVIPKLNQNPVLRYDLGQAYLIKGDLDQAQSQFQEALKIRPTYIPPKISLGRIALARREFGRAQQLADEALRPPYQNAVGPKLIRIEALMGLRDLKTARAELNALSAAAPALKDPKHLLGLLDLAEARYPDAEKRFRELYDANPPDPRGLFGLAQTYASTNRVDQARQLLKTEAGKKPPYERNIKLALAELEANADRFDDAAAIYKGLIAELPKSSDLWVRLGEIYRRAGKYDESLKALDQAKQMNPRDPNAWVQSAMTLEKAGRGRETRPIYEQILKLAPDNAIALNNMAFFLADSGLDLDQALTYAQRAKQQLPNNPDVSDTLGWVYIKKNLSDDAIKIFRDLVQQKPDHVTWRYHLALAYFQKGDKAQARRELETARRSKPTNDEDEKIKALLARIG